MLLVCLVFFVAPCQDPSLAARGLQHGGTLNLRVISPPTTVTAKPADSRNLSCKSGAAAICPALSGCICYRNDAGGRIFRSMNVTMAICPAHSGCICYRNDVGGRIVENDSAKNERSLRGRAQKTEDPMRTGQGYFLKYPAQPENLQSKGPGQGRTKDKGSQHRP